MTRMIINSVLALALLHIPIYVFAPVPNVITITEEIIEDLLRNPEILEDMDFTVGKDRQLCLLAFQNCGTLCMCFKTAKVKINAPTIKLNDVPNTICLSQQGLALKLIGECGHGIMQSSDNANFNKGHVINTWLKQLHFTMKIFSMMKDTEFKASNLCCYDRTVMPDRTLLQFMSPASLYIKKSTISKLISDAILSLNLFEIKKPEDKLECILNMNAFRDNPEDKLKEFIPKIDKFFGDIYGAIEADLLEYPNITKTLIGLYGTETQKPINIQSILPLENESYCALKLFITDDSLRLGENLVVVLEKIREIKQEKLNAAMEADLFNKIKGFNDLLPSPISNKDWAKYLEKMVSMLPTIEGKVLYVDREGRIKRNPKKTCPEDIEDLSCEQLQAKLLEENKMIEEVWWSKTADGYSFKLVFAEDTPQLSLEQDSPDPTPSSSSGPIKQEVAKEDLSELLKIENEAQPVIHMTTTKDRNRPKPQGGVKIQEPEGRGKILLVMRNGEQCPEYTGFLQAALRGEEVTLGKNALGKARVDEKYHYEEMIKFVDAIEKKIEGISVIRPNQYGLKKPACLIARPKGDGFEINFALSNRKGEVSIWRPENK